MNEYFQLIDQAIYLHRSRKPDYDRAVVGLTKGFRKLLEPQREMVNNIVYRIKQDLSLKEKILRRQWYRGVSLPSQILDNIYDCLGIMIECRFMSEEEEVFRAIRSAFTVQAEDGFFECEKLKGIRLDLSRPQPCIQKNGLPNLYIFSSCVNLIAELKGYYWGSGDVPRKVDDHCLDELRYYLMTRPRNTMPPAQISPVLREKERLQRLRRRGGRID